MLCKNVFFFQKQMSFLWWPPTPFPQNFIIFFFYFADNPLSKKKKCQYVQEPLMCLWEGISQRIRNLPVATPSKRNNSQSLSQLPSVNSNSVRSGPIYARIGAGFILCGQPQLVWTYEFSSHSVTQRGHLKVVLPFFWLLSTTTTCLQSDGVKGD